jgi:REP element-mobilizing transposase RayT
VSPPVKVKWQEDYGAVTIRKGEVPKVSRYIDNQEEHHKSGKLSNVLELSETQDEAPHQLYFHLTWATQGRLRLINRDWRPRLLEIIDEQARSKGGIALRYNAMPDHVHLLVRLPPTVVPSEFAGKVKGAASFLANKQIRPRLKLKWQEGYGIVTIREDEVPKVSRYIDNQEEHHRNGRLSDLLERYRTEGNEDWP